jgi:peptidoglycan/xylan/chitin deacetylase (PgdA/CDA1 family)
MYHDVLPQKQVWFDETLSNFKAQMKHIHDRGFHVISTQQLWRHLTTGEPVPKRSLVLTFDDANEGQFLYALPVLKQYGYPATFFIHTGYVGVTTSKSHMTWEQLKAAEETGLIDVEARTVSHPCNMPDLSTEDLRKELLGAIDAVKAHLGHDSQFFSYPCGHFNDRSEDAVKDAGYRLAFDEERGFTNQSPSIFAVNRFTPRRLDEALK